MPARHVILGGSIAGLAGAMAIRRCDPLACITLVSEELHRPYARALLTEYLAGRVGREALDLADAGFFARAGIQVLAGRRAEAVDPVRREVELDSGERLPYDAALIATGARPWVPGPLPARGPGVTSLRTVEDAERIRRRAVEGARVVVAGAGLVGMKVACAVRELGVAPEVVEVAPHILPRVADSEAAALLRRHMARYGVRFHLGTAITGVSTGRGRLKSVSLDTGREIACDLLVVAAGVTPNSEVLRGARSGGIRVSPTMATGLPGVYAAGDVALTRDPIRHEYRSMAIWPHAVAQGRTAGMNMAGQQVQCPPSLQRNAFEALGLPFISAGEAVAPARPGWTVQVDHGPGTYRKRVYREGRLVGAVLVGDVSGAGALQAAIRRQAAEADSGEGALLMAPSR